MTEGTNITTTNYLSGYQYKNNVLQFFPHAEGYVNATQNGTSYTFNYVFNFTDHLGNIRLSYSQDPSTNVLKIIEENHYYPFGLKHTGYNSDQMMYSQEGSTLRIKPVPPLLKTVYNYKFENKELQDELGLNLYDFGLRQYDPAIGRWTSVDPLAEKFPSWSPYNFVFNNPMRFVDPDGREPIDPYEYEIDLKTGKQTMISGLGGKDVNFYHYKGGGVEYNGKTRILNMNTYEEQWMSSSKYMLGYEHRDNTVNYETIFDEFITGTGPEKSLIGDRWHQMNKDIMKSSQFESAIESWKDNGLDSKYYFEGTFGIPGAVKAGTNMTAQMLGKAGVSFYPIGDLVVIMVTDSKSKTSWSLNPFAKKEENNIPRVNGQGGPESTTHQTYIWTMPKDELLKLDD